MELEEFESLLIDNENENLEKKKELLKKKIVFWFVYPCLFCLSFLVIFFLIQIFFLNH